MTIVCWNDTFVCYVFSVALTRHSAGTVYGGWEGSTAGGKVEQLPTLRIGHVTHYTPKYPGGGGREGGREGWKEKSNRGERKLIYREDEGRVCTYFLQIWSYRGYGKGGGERKGEEGVSEEDGRGTGIEERGRLTYTRELEVVESTLWCGNQVT